MNTFYNVALIHSDGTDGTNTF